MNQQQTQSSVESTMKDVQRAIALHRDALLEHPFLRRLEGSGTAAQVHAMLRTLGYFPFGFQDILRIARESCSDSTLERLVRSMEDDDRGHEKWFLHDVTKLGVGLEIGVLFSPECQVSRDVSYRMIAHVVQASEDHCRIAILLALEAAGRAFFERISGYAESAGMGEGLKYFSRSHLQAEVEHRVFEHGSQAELDAVPVPAQSFDQVLTAVAHTFASMGELADAIERAMASA